MNLFRFPVFDEKLKQTYQNADPFPYVVIDDLFPRDAIEEIAESFPRPTEGHWWEYQNVLEKKLARNDWENFPSNIQRLISELQSNAFVSFLEQLTGIKGLITDHTLNGGGLHSISTRGKLDVHADYNYHPITKLDRRLNVLLYLNKDWKPEWKGNLELWDEGMTQCVRSIPPLLGRMVIFNVNDTAYHGHPDPLECPETESRKSIALYYYTNGRPESERTFPHSTIFKRRPQDPIIEEHEQLRQQRAIKRI